MELGASEEVQSELKTYHSWTGVGSRVVKESTRRLKNKMMLSRPTSAQASVLAMILQRPTEPAFVGAWNVIRMYTVSQL